jgi:hypothetical protein
MYRLAKLYNKFERVLESSYVHAFESIMGFSYAVKFSRPERTG